MKRRFGRNLIKLAAVFATLAYAMPAHGGLPVMATGVSFAAREPAPVGFAVSAGRASIDVSGAGEGYVMARYSGPAAKVKLRLACWGGRVYTFDLSTSGVYESFPLTSGSGSYTVNVYENITGDLYALLTGVTVDAYMADELAPFLRPSKYINFNDGSASSEKASELAAGESDRLKIIGKMHGYVVRNIAYDREKAQTVPPGYIPCVDEVLESGKGICFDYAAVLVAMLRSVKIPARLHVGYVSGGLYHAWVSVYSDQAGWADGVYFDGGGWGLMDPTFAAGAGQSAEIMEFIGTGSNYSALYTY